MRLAQINTTCGIGSTGKIAVAISKLLTENGIENEILYSTATDDYEFGKQCGNKKEQTFQALRSRVFGNYGFNSERESKRIIAELESFSPDTVLLHNIHGHDCDLEVLFAYLKKKKIRIFWTFHDCWAFTGYCTYFTFVGCEKWKRGCGGCPQRKEYSWVLDRSGEMYQRKQNVLTNLNLTVITPSKWLAGLVRQSFLKDYPVKVINNGIDLSVFKPTESDFRVEYGIPDEKYLILGVAFDWGKRKGLDVFTELAGRLDSGKYQIVLVGTDDSVDKTLPENIISVHKTQNQKELAEIYTAADLFVNPTREDNYPTVNMESIACGTAVLTFRTGGSPEIIDETCGSVVECDDIDALEKEIIRICRAKPYSKEDCLERAKAFDMNDRFNEYVELCKLGCKE